MRSARPAARRAALAAAAAVALPLLAPLAPASAAPPAPNGFRVSTATKAFKDSAGRTWEAGRGFAGGYRSSTVTRPIAGTVDDRLYQTGHRGMSGFRSPLADGTYDVTLHLAETYWTRAGERVFDVAAEGQPVATGVDVLARVGRDTAHALVVPVVVTDGALDLAFTHRVDDASVGAVSAVRTGPAQEQLAAPVAAPSPTASPSTDASTSPTTSPTPEPAQGTSATASPGAAPAPVTTTSPAPVAVEPTPTASTTPAPTAAPAPVTTWKSGASAGGGSEVQRPDGAFAQWRGRDLDVAGSWADNNTAQVELWSLWPTLEYGQWDRDLDLAVGAIGWDETWAQAATGAYDARWRRSLTRAKELWTARDRGTLYLRFAHEMNGSWYPWSVTAEKKDAFVASWKRYRALQQELFPEAQLVFSVNRESVGLGLDWRQLFPGKAYADVLAVDYYNQWPHADTDAEWTEHLTQTDPWGGPKGLATHQAFARSQGLPFALSEWGNNAEWGESPLFMRRLHEWFAANAGTGPGQLLYEVYFNPAGAESGKWELFPSTRQPLSADAYRAAF